ncbi:hypothetical protein DVH05_026814 [Phytophthora capsici]|nr:hypothetical protein DVH05_026814 [Phytophthora capsici]
MDTVSATDVRLSGSSWPCQPPFSLPLSPAVLLPFRAPTFRPRVDSIAHAKATWSLVLQDFWRVSHLVRRRFTPVRTERPSHPAVVLPLPKDQVLTAAHTRPSAFDTPPTRSCWVLGRDRCVPQPVFDALREAAIDAHAPFPMESAFLAAGPGPRSVPLVDLRILDALVASRGLGISGTLELFRGQTADDYRPNKALRPWLYRKHLATYPGLEPLCTIAQVGLTPPWLDPLGRRGVRPVPANYPGADTGAPIVTDKLLADYYNGRCIIATMPTLIRDPQFYSSSFDLVPKKDKPLHVDGTSRTVFQRPDRFHCFA